MITCQDARHLFSRYLDGDLSSSLKTELHAHQLNCSTCRDELSMLETCGEVIALDLCEPKLSESFTDRVLAAREAQLARVKPRRRTRMFIYAGS
ncbi:MAG: zf-HC2 domain-containing protein, partial [Planctomycetota bacterium]